MKKFSGIDLHSDNSMVVVSDEEDRIVYQRRLANDLAGIVQALEPHREELIGVVVEATYNWYWLVDGLMEAGYCVHLANTAAIKKYEGLKYSGDAADAAYLAHLLRLGLLPEGYIYPREARAGRDLARKRMQLVRYRTAQILAIENILARQTGGRMRSNEIKRLTAGWRRRSCSRPAASRVSRRWAISVHTAVALTACGKAMVRKRAQATRRMATSISAGPSWKRHAFRCATARKPSASTSARNGREIRSWPPKLWRTNSRGHVITCCGNIRRLRWNDVLLESRPSTTSQS